jgi:hypothetical protein
MARRNLSADEIRWILTVDAKGAQGEIQKFSSVIDRLKKENIAYAASTKEMNLFIKEQKERLRELEKQGKKNSVEYNAISKKITKAKYDIEQNTQAIKENNKAISDQNKKIEDVIKTMKVEDMTMSQLRRRANELQKQLDNTSKSLSPDSYKALQKELTEVTNRMGVVRNANRSLVQQFSAIPGPVGMASKAIVGVGTALKALIANPVGAVIMVIVGAFTALSKIINSNEESINLLNQILAPLKALLAAVLNVVQGLVVKFLEWTQVAIKGISWLLSKIPGLSGVMEKVNEKARDAIQLEKDKQALQIRTREQTVETAKKELEIAKLRNESKRRDLYSDSVRLEKLNEAVRLEKEISEEKVYQAKESLRLLELEASRTKNLGEIEDKLAQARANVYNAEKEHYNHTRRLESEISSTVLEGQRERAAAAKEAEQKRTEAARKALDDQLKDIENNLNQEINILKKQRAEGLLVEKDYNEKVRQLTISDLHRKITIKGQERSQILQYESQILDEQLNQQQDADKLLLQELTKAKDQQIQMIEAARNKKLEMLQETETDQKLYALRAQEIEVSTAAMREAVYKEFAETIEKAEFQNAQNRIAAVEENGKQILVSESATLKARDALQKRYLKTSADFERLYNVKNWEQRRADELAILERYRQENLMSEETYRTALAAIEKKYQDEKQKAREQAMLTGLKDQYEKELEVLQEFLQNQFLSHEEYEEALLKLRLRYAAKYAQDAASYMQESNSIVSDLMQAETLNVEKRYDAEIAAAGNNAEKVEALEKEKAKKKLAIEKKYADVQFAITAAQIVASTAMAVMQAFAQLGPIAGAIAGAIVAVAGVAQLVVANAQRKKVKSMTLDSGGSGDTPPPTGKITMREGFAEGGYNTDYSGGGYTPQVGKYEQTGWVPIHGGEYVVASDEMARPDVVDKVRSIERIRRRRTLKNSNSQGFAEGGHNSPNSAISAGMNADRKAMENLSRIVQRLLDGDVVINYGITEMEAKQRRKQEVESTFTKQS